MKILFVGEFSKIATGYGKISGELIQRFHDDGYEVAELATFCGENDPRIKLCPWKVYPNLPTNDEENTRYSSNPQNANGKWKFEEVCLDFQPTHIFANSDPFMYEFQMDSPFREYFNWIITAPVDGIPQQNQWLHIFDNADGLVTYTKWGKKVLEEYGLKVDGIMAPVASKDFYPIPKEDIEKFKKAIGAEGRNIIGTVMRNQPRKLFNDVFEAFAEYLKEDPEALLYCHTTYPDAGWDFSELLIKYNIISNVLFTYKCKSCHQSYPNYFQDFKTICPFCKKPTSKMPDGQDCVDNKTLNKIFNIFNCCLQISSREGFGMPQIEAAACDIPVINVPYAGMSDMKESIGSFGVNIKGFYLSYPMNMMEAVPDIEDLAKTISFVVNTTKKNGFYRKQFEKSYGSWDKTYKEFKSIIDSLPVKEWKKKDITAPMEYQELKLSNEDYVKVLIYHVLNRPDLLGSYLMTRFIRDLNSGITSGGICGNYFTENIEQRHIKAFSRKDAYDICINQRKFNDYWQYRMNNKGSKSE